MKIKLTEVPEEGRTYTWNNNTGEVNAALADLIAKNSYEVDFFIKPLNPKDFDLVGKIKTSTKEICSRCANDINYDIQARFHEILIPKQEQPRNSKYSKVNHVSDIPDDGIETSEYENMVFNMGDFLHEVVALAVPFNPRCPEMVDGKPSECKILQKAQPFSYDENMISDKKQNPFAALKNIKLN